MQGRSDMAEQPGRNGITGGSSMTRHGLWVAGLLAAVRSTTERRLAAPTRSAGSPGQIVALFAISVLAMVALLGLIIDGGNIYVQRRTTQNAADAASLAGTRALMEAFVRTDSKIVDAV